MQKSKSIRVTNKVEKELRKFIKTSPKKVYKIQFASEAIQDKIILETNLRTQENINYLK